MQSLATYSTVIGKQSVMFMRTGDFPSSFHLCISFNFYLIKIERQYFYTYRKQNSFKPEGEIHLEWTYRKSILNIKIKISDFECTY